MKCHKVRVIRHVPDSEEHNYYGQAVHRGAEFWTFTGPTYGCVDDVNGIALSEFADMGPFFEFPRNAIEDVNENE
jgi:hypothetical protein